MRILVVASFNRGRFAPFVEEQAEALRQEGCVIDWFGVQGKGIRGYLGNLFSLKRKIRTFAPEIIHAHYGMSGLLACLQRKVPVVVTYHGSDINDKKVLRFSQIAMRLSAWNIFVSRKTLEIAKPKRRYTLLPCGVDLSDAQLMVKNDARSLLHWDNSLKYVLFAGAFNNEVKNASLAKKAIGLLKCSDVELAELKGYSREEVTLLMCAADVLLMTSFNEGSPQVVKEAMACGCPIVSVDVGDVKERVEGIDGCYVAHSREPQEIADLLLTAVAFNGKTNGRERIIADGLDNEHVASQLIAIYDKVC